MGDFMKQDDVYIPSLLELLNIRFAPAQSFEGQYYGGIAEMAAIQKEFGIFREGRLFADSIVALGIGGRWNPGMQQNWRSLLASLARKPSNRSGIYGDPAIVQTIVEDLQQDKPSPIFFRAHDSRAPEQDRVTIEMKARPLFYLEQDYITISIPMRPKSNPQQ